mmetsp:Transcript_65584/g.186040  ORF Transcript_65584/g.186040 Transcript_65584/m.186040 type:complete len:255 (-) Transcript_65584:186-950(-)
MGAASTSCACHGASCACNCVRSGLAGIAKDEAQGALQPKGITASLRVLGGGSDEEEVELACGTGAARPSTDPLSAMRGGSPGREPGSPAGGQGAQGARAEPSPGRTSSPEPGSWSPAPLGTWRQSSGTPQMRNSARSGDFLDSFKHGNATLNWDDGRQYRGQFAHGKFHGSGVMTWPDGRKYIGQYEEDRKHGQGTFTWQDGRCYQGQWVSGTRHGVGIYTNAKGSARKGIWRTDRPLYWTSTAPEDTSTLRAL